MQGSSKLGCRARTLLGAIAMILLVSSVISTTLLSYQPSLATRENEDHPPRARAGPDQVVYEGTLVTLNASASRDPDGDSLSYEWTQVKGRKVVLSDPISPSPSFLAPNIKNNRTTLVFQLTVSDSSKNGSDPDSVRITILKSEQSTSETDQTNHPPIANAGEDQYAEDGRVSLNGSSSYDPDNDPITYSWIQLEGPSVELQNSTSALPQFSVAELSERQNVTFVFELTVSDGFENGTSTDTVSIIILDSNYTIPGEAGIEENQQNLEIAQGSAEIHGTVYVDQDFDGSRDDSEAGISDVAIRLFGYEKLENIVEYDNGPLDFVINHDTNKIYALTHVHNSFNETLVIVDGITQEEISSIPLGDTSFGGVTTLSINPLTGTVYAGNSRDGFIYVIDGESDEIVDTIYQAALSIQIDSERNLIYILDFSNSILVLDGDTGEVVENLVVSFSVSGFLLESEARLLYLKELNDNRLHAYDLDEKSVMSTLDLTGTDEHFGRMQVHSFTHELYALVHRDEICERGEDDVFVCTGGENYLAIIESEDELRIRTLLPLGDRSGSFAINFAADLMFLLESHSAVLAIDLNTNEVIATLPVRFGANLLKLDPISNIVYVVSFGSRETEPPVPGSIAALSGSFVDSALSTENGAFAFGNLSSGNYILSEIAPPSSFVIEPVTGTYQLSVTDGQIVEGVDFGNAPASSVGKLTVNSAYLELEGGLSGIPIKVFSGTEEIASGLTPVTFTLEAGREYTVAADNVDFTFFSQWHDGFPGLKRNITIAGGSELTLLAFYLSIPTSEVVTVNVTATLLDENGNETPLGGVRSLIHTGDSIWNIMDHGESPREYRIAEGLDYHIFAINSGNLIFDHWVDPLTSDPVFSRELEFTGQKGLTLNAVYHESNSTLLTIPVTSKLLNGTVVTGMFNKLESFLLSEGSFEPVVRGHTPNEYHVDRDHFYTAVGSDLDGLVLDHWEATGGPFINKIVFSNEYPFQIIENLDIIDSLTAVYRVVPDDDFAAVPVDAIGENVPVEIPSKINDGILLTLDEVSTTGNVTASETSVVSDFDLFEGVSLTYGNATFIVGASEPADENTTSIYGTSGPVLRVNDAYLTTSGDKEVTIHYDPSKIPEGQSPRMLHFNGTDWEDVTVRVDQDAQTITGRLTSLSPFVAGYALPESKFGIGGVKGGATITLESGSDVTLTPSLGRHGQLHLIFENIESSGNLTIVPRELEDIKDALETIDESGETATVAVGSEVEAIVGTVFDTDTSELDYSGSVEMSLPYDPDMLPDGTSESDVRFLHYTGSKWEDKTISVDTQANVVTGMLDSLSPVVAAVPVESEPPSSGGGGGSSSGGGGPPSLPVLPQVPNNRTTMDNSTLASVKTGSGVLVPVDVNLGSGRGNTTLAFAFENVTAAGQLRILAQNSSELRGLFDNRTETSVVMMQASNFTALGTLFNISAYSGLEFVGPVDVTVQYDEDLLGNLLGGTDESDLRFLYYNGSQWQESTIYVNQTTNSITGEVASITPMLVVATAAVYDGTFGETYFAAHPLERLTIDGHNLQVEDLSSCIRAQSEADQCEVTVSGKISNHQRHNQTFIVIAQTVDALGLVQSVAFVNGSLGAAEEAEISFGWQFQPTTPLSYGSVVRIMVVDNLAFTPEIIAQGITIPIT